MEKYNIKDRLTFLAELFDVFECDSETKTVDSKLKVLSDEGYISKIVTSNHNVEDVIAILSEKINDKERIVKKVSVCSSVFSDMISSDPTENKMYLQWMLNLFARLLKDKDSSGFEMAARLVVEDLPQANKYLTIFEDNKRKRSLKSYVRVVTF